MIEVKELAFLDYMKVDVQKSQDFYIASLDPIGFDEHVDRLILFNKEGNVKGLVQLLYPLMPFPEEIRKFDYAQCAAAMRDLGMFLGSIKRLGVEPIEAVPELEYVLEELGSKTDLPPRDTLLHYTVWNPDNHRVRTYTGLRDEKELIRSVAMSTHPLLKAIHILMELHRTAFEDERFVQLCAEVEEHFRQVIDGIVHAKRFVSPEVFAKDLRFYFEPIRFYKSQVIGPGAVEMPMFVFDHLLWSSDCESDAYRSFKVGFLPYILPYLRDVYDSFDARPSLVTKMCHALEHSKNISLMLNAAKALLKVCNLQKSFRMPHKKLAEEAYAHEDQSLKEKGSGGYAPTILSDIIHLNLKQINNLTNAMEHIHQLGFLLQRP